MQPPFMIKYIISTLLLFSCHSELDSKHEMFSTDTTTTFTPNKKDSGFKKTVKRFDNQQPFEIVSFINTVNKNTTDTDTLKCSSWTVSKMEIEKIIKNSEPIDGTTWDLSFLVLTCTKSVSVVQNGQQFNVEINGASFFSVNNGDTTVLFGDYKKSDRKYFIEAPADK